MSKVTKQGTTKVFLAAVDGSDGATSALKQAVVAASTDGARLVVLTVIPRGLLAGPVSGDLREFARVERLAGGQAEARSFAAEDILAEAKIVIGGHGGGTEPVYLSRAGNPAEEILACAEEWSADAIYLGSRGLGPLGTLFVGSVSREVARAATCHVVIVSKEGLTARRDSSTRAVDAAFPALL